MKKLEKVENKADLKISKGDFVTTHSDKKFSDIYNTDENILGEGILKNNINNTVGAFG